MKFKLLDSYTAEDLGIFFGREAEIEQLYSLIHRADLLLVYGRSGTGKTSVVQCGLAGRFKPTDRFEILVRRQEDLNAALARDLQRVAVTGGGTPIPDGASVGDAIYSIYLDRLRPIHLIFDQFEELLLLGSREERDQFFASIAGLLQRKLRCKVIFVLREEFIAMLDPYESALPGLFANRFRVEPMTRRQLEDVVVGTATAAGVTLAEGRTTAGQILDKLGSGTQLAYVQVYLDKLYRLATSTPVVFTADLVTRTGALGDVLADFLDEQSRAVQASLKGAPPDAVQMILEEFATLDGTKQPIAPADLKERHADLVPFIDPSLQALEGRRVLRLVDGVYELAHDSLARRIADARGAERKMQLKAQRLIQDRLAESDGARTRLLIDDDLDFIKPFEGKLDLTRAEREFYERSVQARHATYWRRMRRLAATAAVIVIALSAGLVWALQQRRVAVEQRERAERIVKDTRAAVGDLFRIEGSLESPADINDAREALRARARWLVARLGISDADYSTNTSILFWDLLREGDDSRDTLQVLDAKDWYEKARTMAEEEAKLSEDSDGDLTWKRNAAVANAALGDLYVEPNFENMWEAGTDRLALAARAYDTAAATFTMLAAAQPNELQSKQDLYNVNLSYGRLALERGDSAAAVERYRSALKIVQQMTDDEADKDPSLGMSIPRAMAQVAAYRLIAEAQEPQGESPEAAAWAPARQSYSDAIALAQMVFEAMPDNAAVTFEVWALQIAKGNLELHAGAFGAARTAYSEAQRLNEFLAEGSQRNIAVIYDGLGNIAMAEKKWAVARTQYQAEAGVLQHRAQLWPDNEDVQRMLAGCYYNLGNVETMFPSPNLGLARSLFRKSETIGKWLEGRKLGTGELDRARAALADLGTS